MKISDKLQDVYEGYYEDNNNLDKKRAIAARQTIEHLCQMVPEGPQKLLDIGAGNGSLLAEFDQISYATELHAIEISPSGLSEIQKRNLKSLCSARQFDGYLIEEEDQAYELGVAVHVLEHVEHERAFIEEITRVCEKVYIEVPLEMTLSLEKSIRMSRPFGHLNFYNSVTFRNLLETCDLDVLSLSVFSNHLAYEQFVSGKMIGTIKYFIRTGLLTIAPTIAPSFMTYLCGAVCQKKTKT